MSALYGDSRYVDRVPIGLPDLVKTFPAQRLRDFYRDQYHPDRMAVVAVGDLDPDATEALIREHFSGIAAAPRVERDSAYSPRRSNGASHRPLAFA